MTELKLSKTVVSPKADFWFLSFPIWIPILYYYLIMTFPAYDLYFFVGVMLLLGEPHFGATWLFFLDKRNHKWLLENKTFSIAIPFVLGVFFIILSSIFGIPAALLLVMIFSVFHVIRQSIGVCKLFCAKSKLAFRTSEAFIWITSLIGFVVGLSRFIFKRLLKKSPNELHWT